MAQPIEVELKFLVRADARAALVAELDRGATRGARVSMAAVYLDTPDRRLARAGLAWRLRREGRRWVQTLKSGGGHALERFEHEVVRPRPQHDATLHAGTLVGDKLLTLLRAAERDGLQVGPRFGTTVRRTVRRVRTRGALVEIAFDEGRLSAGDASLPIREIEFELVSGQVAPMLALADRWRQRHGLVFDPRSKAERGDRLAEGSPFPPVRKSARPPLDAGATAVQAFGVVLDECLAQVAHNAVGLIDGDPAQRVDHVHQLRVGIRRLRSALRSFEGWVPSPPPALVGELRALFDALGAVRDGDVLDSGVAAELQKAGAPRLETPRSDRPVPSAADVVGSDAAQHALLGWMTWRAGLAEPGPLDVAGDAKPQALRRDAERRLRRWHRRIVDDGKVFDTLDEAQLHALRKRVKRQRYAVEFFAGLFKARAVDRYLKALSAVQERMGELNDLFVARSLYQPLAETDPAAWFAVGWIAARVQVVRSLTGQALARLAEVEAPTR